MVTIVFEDRGQGFREFDVDGTGRIVAVRPGADCVWRGFMVASEAVRIGGRLEIDLDNAAWTHLGLPEWIEIEAPVAEVRKGGSTWAD